MPNYWNILDNTKKLKLFDLNYTDRLQIFKMA